MSFCECNILILIESESDCIGIVLVLPSITATTVPFYGESHQRGEGGEVGGQGDAWKGESNKVD